jgi:hypothetical protein
MGTFDLFQSNSLSKDLAHCSNFALAVRNKKAAVLAYSTVLQICHVAQLDVRLSHSNMVLSLSRGLWCVGQS